MFRIILIVKIVTADQFITGKSLYKLNHCKFKLHEAIHLNHKIKSFLSSTCRTFTSSLMLLLKEQFIKQKVMSGLMQKSIKKNKSSASQKRIILKNYESIYSILYTQWFTNCSKFKFTRFEIDRNFNKIILNL